MTDTAYDEFMSRGWGTSDTGEQARQDLLAKRGETLLGQVKDNAGTVGSVADPTSQRAGTTAGLTSIGQGLSKAPAQMDGLTGDKMTAGSIAHPSGGSGISGSGLASAGMDIAGQAHNIMAFANNMKGGQFDTSAHGGGVGSAAPAIIQGAQQGGKAGEAIGSIAGPKGKVIGKVVGTIAGGLNSTFAHQKAKREYVHNRKDLNIKEDAMERAQSEQDYRRSEGLASLADLKSLRQKQLGIIS